MITDASVARMTDAQWVFEAHALRRKEEQDTKMQAEALKAHARILRDTLIGVLGLHLFPGAMTPDEGTADPDGPPPFIPAAMLFSNHHLLNAVLEQQKKNEAGSSGDSAHDAAFEEFSKKLAAGDTADLDPILVGAPIDLSQLRAQREASEARRLGVKVASSPVVAPSRRAAASRRIELEPGLFVEEEVAGG